jgi:hypothetical protein
MCAFIRPFTISASMLLVVASARAVDTSAQPTTAAAANAPVINHTDPGVAAIGDVNKMLDAKVDDGVIIAYIHNSHASFNLSAADIIALKDHGASPEVLKALMESPPAATASVYPQTGAPQTMLTVEAPMTPSADYSQAPADGYDYSSYPYYPYYSGYPYYYPSYASYGWPYFYFSPFFFSPFFHFHGHNDFHSGHFHNGFVSHPWGTSGGLMVHGTTRSAAVGGFHGSTVRSFSGGGFHSFSGGGMHMGGGGFHGGGGGGHR